MITVDLGWLGTAASPTNTKTGIGVIFFSSDQQSVAEMREFEDRSVDKPASKTILTWNLEVYSLNYPNNSTGLAALEYIRKWAQAQPKFIRSTSPDFVQRHGTSYVQVVEVSYSNVTDGPSWKVTAKLRESSPVDIS